MTCLQLTHQPAPPFVFLNTVAKKIATILIAHGKSSSHVDLFLGPPIQPVEGNRSKANMMRAGQSTWH